MRPKTTILLVDDNEVMLSVRTFLLETWGYAVVSASSGKQALEELKLDPRKFDLLVTDLMMPEMSGNTLALKAKKIDPDLRVLIVAGASFLPGGNCHADGLLPEGCNNAIELLARIKLITSRKRGPKKQYAATA